MKYDINQQLFEKMICKQRRSFIMLLFACLALISCSKDMDIQTNFPFELEIMPVPKKVVAGEVVEIPCHIKRTGYYKETSYSFRYFQYEGAGTLMFQVDKPLITNKLYKVPKDSFMLYYRPKSKEAHSFQIWVADQFGNEKTAKFDFN